MTRVSQQTRSRPTNRSLCTIPMRIPCSLILLDAARVQTMTLPAPRDMIAWRRGAPLPSERYSAVEPADAIHVTGQAPRIKHAGLPGQGNLVVTSPRGEGALAAGQ